MSDTRRQSRSVSPSDALQRLLAGNEHFVRGKPAQRPPKPGQRARLKTAQHPFAAILACSDSRVPPEMVFDQGLGDLFIVRVAGNVVAAETLGSLAYALAHLRTPLFVVLGHEGCGAVQAALRAKFHHQTEHRVIAELLEAVLPGLKGINPAEPADAQWRHAVEANVRWAIRQLAATPAGRAAVSDGRIQLVGAVYELATGRVRFLEEQTRRDLRTKTD